MSVDLRENYVGDNYVKQWENQLRSLSSEIVNSGNRKIPGLLLKVQGKENSCLLFFFGGLGCGELNPNISCKILLNKN